MNSRPTGWTRRRRGLRELRGGRGEFRLPGQSASGGAPQSARKRDHRPGGGGGGPGPGFQRTEGREPCPGPGPPPGPVADPNRGFISAGVGLQPESRWTCITAGNCPAASLTWQLVYRGAWQRLTGMGHGWRERHQARAESQDWVTSRLRQTVGAPTPEGERRPFMRGAYRARAELIGRDPGDGERTGLGGERLGHLEGDGDLPR